MPLKVWIFHLGTWDVFTRKINGNCFMVCQLHFNAHVSYDWKLFFQDMAKQDILNVLTYNTGTELCYIMFDLI